MALALHGIGVSKGYATGKAYILRRNQPDVIECTLPVHLIEKEVERFLDGLTKTRQQLEAIRDRVSATAPADITSFIDTHLLILKDSNLARAPIELIRERRCNAEWALKIQRDLVVQVFEEMDDAYLSARKADIDQVIWRIQHILLNDSGDPGDIGSSHRLEDSILVADDLSPADTILMQHQGMLALVTEYGGPLSHTAILARSLGVPAIVGVHDARRYLHNDDLIIVDGHEGVVLTELDDTLIDYYRGKQQEEQRRNQELNKLKKQPALTRDNVSITLQANIELPEDLVAVRKVAADGVGLYRTEFLFMNRSDIPDEEEHLESYLDIIKALKGRPLTIRTADLGADKQVDGGRSGGPVATNPALGLRAIRLCLKDLDLFRPQLRAILRASAAGPVRLMIPMLSSPQELLQVLGLIKETKHELSERGQAFAENIPVGGMIEVPAAAVCAPYFARHLDFLSIGTNDLIQYTLAIDRIDDSVNYLYDPLHPAVLQLIYTTIRAGRKAGIPVSLCGEMAGDPRYTRLLLGLGLTEFSMHPANLLEVKQTIRDSRIDEAERIVKRVLRASDPKKLSRLLRKLTAGH